MVVALPRAKHCRKLNAINQHSLLLLPIFFLKGQELLSFGEAVWLSEMKEALEHMVFAVGEAQRCLSADRLKGKAPEPHQIKALFQSPIWSWDKYFRLLNLLFVFSDAAVLLELGMPSKQETMCISLYTYIMLKYFIAHYLKILSAF